MKRGAEEGKGGRWKGMNVVKGNIKRRKGRGKGRNGGKTGGRRHGREK